MLDNEEDKKTQTIYKNIFYFCISIQKAPNQIFKKACLLLLLFVAKPQGRGSLCGSDCPDGVADVGRTGLSYTYSLTTFLNSHIGGTKKGQLLIETIPCVTFSNPSRIFLLFLLRILDVLILVVV